MARQIGNYTEERRVQVTGTPSSTIVIRYQITDTVDDKFSYWGELLYTEDAGILVSAEKTAIEDAIKTAEGIS